MVNKDTTQENIDPMQIKVDKFSGYIVLLAGLSFVYPFLDPVISGKNFSTHIEIYIYSFLMVILCYRKGIVLIQKAGGPASISLFDNQKWQLRLISLVIFILIFISFIFFQTGTEMFVVIVPLLIVYM
jgi:hypothetical protein